MGSLIAAALARAQGFLVEPAPAAHAPPMPVPAAASLRACEPVQVAVTGLSRQSGATTLAAGLAHALVVPGVRPAHLVSLRTEAGERRPAPTGVAVWDLPPALRDPAEVGDYCSTLARLASGGGNAAVVWDVGADDVARAARVLEASSAVACVADGEAEPALCTLVCEMLGERYGRILLVANRVRDDEGWAGRCAVAIPEARLAAMLLARGRAPGGAVGDALARLAALVEERA